MTRVLLVLLVVPSLSSAAELVVHAGVVEALATGGYEAGSGGALHVGYEDGKRPEERVEYSLQFEAIPLHRDGGLPAGAVDRRTVADGSLRYSRLARTESGASARLFLGLDLGLEFDRASAQWEWGGVHIGGHFGFGASVPIVGRFSLVSLFVVQLGGVPGARAHAGFSYTLD